MSIIIGPTPWQATSLGRPLGKLHPILFLVDSLWFLCLAGYLIHDVVKERSGLWLILVALLLWMVVTGLKHFARFRGTRLTPLRTASSFPATF